MSWSWRPRGSVAAPAAPAGSSPLFAQEGPPASMMTVSGHGSSGDTATAS